MNKAIACLLIVFLWGSLSSCSFYKLVTGKSRTHQKIVLAGIDSTKTPAGPPLMQKQDTVARIDSTGIQKKLIEELMPVWKNRLVFNTFNGKAKMRFDGPDSKQDFTAHIRIRKDSVIWINITAALGGLNVARVLVTIDSFFMINYLDKEVIRIPLDKAARILPSRVDFQSLQNLIIGEPLRDGMVTGASDFGGSWTLQVEDSSYLQMIVYNKSDSTMRTGRMRTHNPNGPQAMTEYGSYINSPNGRISTGRVLKLVNGSDEYTLNMNFSRIDFDQPLEYPFSIPDSYTVKQ